MMAVGEKLFKPSKKGEDATNPPPPDPWEGWTRAEVLTAFIIGFILCLVYQLNLFSKLLGTITTDGASQPDWLTYFGYFLTAVVLAGGSGGMQKILAAISAIAKGMKTEAKARILEAAYRIDVAALQIRGLPGGPASKQHRERD